MPNTWKAVRGADWNFSGEVRLKTGAMKDLTNDSLTVIISSISSNNTLTAQTTLTSSGGDIAKTSNGTYTFSVDRTTTETLANSKYYLETWHIDGSSDDQERITDGYLVLLDSAIS